MVELVLHHTGQIALNPLVVVVKLLVVPFYTDTGGTNHLFMDGWQRQTTLFAGVRLCVVILHDMRIDIHLTETFIFGHILSQHVEIDNRQAYRTTNLGCCQSDAFALGQCLPHIGNELFQFRIVGGDIFRHLPQYRLTIYINR